MRRESCKCKEYSILAGERGQRSGRQRGQQWQRSLGATGTAAEWTKKHTPDKAHTSQADCAKDGNMVTKHTKNQTLVLSSSWEDQQAFIIIMKAAP